MSDELRAVLMEMMQATSDRQRHILHDRLNYLTRFATESDRSDFVIEVMNGLPYPDFKDLLITFFGEDAKTNK